MFNFLKKYFFIILLLLAPFKIYAADLYFSPSVEKVGPGDSFYIDIRVDVKECINTISAAVKFPSDKLSLSDFFVGESILSLWIEKPESTDLEAVSRSGILKFSGGIPGGYCGKIAGDPGISNVVGRLVFRAVDDPSKFGDNEKISISFADDVQIFLNDGFGTLDEVVLKKMDLSLSKESLSNIDQRQNTIDADNIPPEPFVVELYSTPSVYNGQKYIVFSTVDKQTGIDYYQVMEISPEENAGVKPKRSWLDILLRRMPPVATWEFAKTPHLLRDQGLSSIIKVKAVDKAGNERAVDYVPSKPVEQVESKSLIDYVYWIVPVSLLFVVFIFLQISKKKKNLPQ